MEILKKTLHLNYSEQKGQKTIQKSYAFSINTETTDDIAREVADELAKLVSKTIDNNTLTNKVTL